MVLRRFFHYQTIMLHKNRGDNAMEKQEWFFRFCIGYLVWMSLGLLVTGQNAYAQSPPPEIFNIEHRWPADIDSPFGKYTTTRIKQYLSEFPKEAAEYGVIEPGDEVELVTTVLYTYPVRYPVYIRAMEPNLYRDLSRMNGNKLLPQKGDYIYLLAYTGEGLYLAWYENQVLYVPGDGIQGLAVSYRGGKGYNNWGDYEAIAAPENDFWICVKTNEDKAGWLKYTNYNDWQGRYKSSIFYTK